MTTDKRLSILIVDDTPDNLFLINELLKDKYRIRIAKNGKKAKDLLADQNPELEKKVAEYKNIPTGLFE